jgi:hypothetical protein
MVTMFGNSSDPKAYRTNISQLLEESDELQDNSSQLTATPSAEPVISQTSSGSSIPINYLVLSTQNSDDISLNAANDNGLPTVNMNAVAGSSENASLTSAFK